jgi:hypothetical protein
MGDLESVLPDDLKKKAIPSGHEIVFAYDEALSAIGIATDHEIAVLGLESFEVRNDGLQPVDYSGYEFRVTGSWSEFVKTNNVEAERWIKEHPLGENHGYILTSTSKNEFASLKSPAPPR